jgi:hypothetical protein
MLGRKILATLAYGTLIKRAAFPFDLYAMLELETAFPGRRQSTERGVWGAALPAKKIARFFMGPFDPIQAHSPALFQAFEARPDTNLWLR